MANKMSIATMCNGAVQERIDRALRKVSENILDPNTDGSKKREISIKITFIPNEDDREDVAVGIQVATKLAEETGITTSMWMQKDLRSGNIGVAEHIKGQIRGQITLDELGMSLKEEQKKLEQQPEEKEEPKFDPETGEIYEEDQKEEAEDDGRVIDLRKVN